MACTGDPRFFQRSGPYHLAKIAKVARGDAPQLDLWFSGVAPLQCAGPHEISFVDNRRYRSALTHTRAGAVLVHPDLKASVPRTSAPIVTSEPYAAWARVGVLFHPSLPIRPGIHATASVDRDVSIDASTEIGPFAVIEVGAKIGAGCRIGAGSVIGSGVIIGPDCRIGAHVTISHALVGARVYIHPGARIGQEGFGFAVTENGFLAVPQLGRVILEDDVEVGANTTIDRGSARDTVIGLGSRIDNLVQIGHNVTIGRYCVVVAQVGIAGSVTIEDYSQIGGQAAIAGHIRIGRGAQIGAQAGVMSDVASQAKMLGSPAQPRSRFLRQIATLKQIVGR